MILRNSAILIKRNLLVEQPLLEDFIRKNRISYAGRCFLSRHVQIQHRVERDGAAISKKKVLPQSKT